MWTLAAAKVSGHAGCCWNVTTASRCCVPTWSAQRAERLAAHCADALAEVCWMRWLPTWRASLLAGMAAAGYFSSALFSLWAPELGFQAARIRSFAPEAGCGACDECKRKVGASLGLFLHLHAVLRRGPRSGSGRGSPPQPPPPACDVQVAPAAGAEPQLGLQVLCVEPDDLGYADLVNLRQHVFGSSEAWGVDWCAAAMVAAARHCCAGCWLLIRCTCGAPHPCEFAPLTGLPLYVQAPAACDGEQPQQQQWRWQRRQCSYASRLWSRGQGSRPGACSDG